MNKLTITKDEKIIYRFLEICKFFISHNDDQYFMFYTGSSLDFQHPYASCKLSVKEIEFDMFAGLEPGMYSIRQTPKAVYELNMIACYVPKGLKYINFFSALEQSRFALSLNKDEAFKASMITDRTGIIFKDDDVKVLNKFSEISVSYIENSNVLVFVNEEEFFNDVYITVIVINPLDDLLNTLQLALDLNNQCQSSSSDDDNNEQLEDAEDTEGVEDTEDYDRFITEGDEHDESFTW